MTSSIKCDVHQCHSLSFRLILARVIMFVPMPSSIHWHDLIDSYWHICIEHYVVCHRVVLTVQKVVQNWLNCSCLGHQLFQVHDLVQSIKNTSQWTNFTKCSKPVATLAMGLALQILLNFTKFYEVDYFGNGARYSLWQQKTNIELSLLLLHRLSRKKIKYLTFCDPDDGVR